MVKHTVLAVLALLGAGSLQAQVASDDLARPPADARHFVIVSTGGKHGDSWSWRLPDGTRMSRESMNLRGQVWEVDQRGTPGRRELVQNLTIRGVTPQGDAAETYVQSGTTGKWKSSVDGGESLQVQGRFYVSYGGTIDGFAWFLEALLASPGKSMQLLPGGTARAERLMTMQVGQGKLRQPVTLWQISGIGATPYAVWADRRQRFFATTSGIAWIPAAYADEVQRMEKVQTTAMAAQAPIIARKLVTVPAGAVAFTGVKLFDADGVRFVPDQTVVVSGGRITEVGAAGQVPVPSGARVFDGRGKTLIPGLWDSHAHMGGDYSGVRELSLGVTSVRDPGGNNARTVERRARVAKGDLIYPNVYASSLIDGKGPYAAQVANLATSQDEAIARVREAAAQGFIGVKFYGTFDAAWLPAAIAEAHKLGLHVHGHIPHGIRPSQALKDGYDEITHINWIVMEGVPASVLPENNGILRFQGPGRYARDMDLDSPEMTALIRTMAEHKIYSDPTMVAFEGLYVPESGEITAAYTPFLGTMPPQTERGFREGGFAVPAGLTRADYRASWAKMIELLGKMHRAGVPIVAGTDGSGIEIVHELEIYQQAGMTAAEALATATIVPARLVRKDKDTGSIAVGKAADLVLVNGDPERRLADLRQTETVMLGGKLLDADALRTAAGFSGRPRQ